MSNRCCTGEDFKIIAESEKIIINNSELRIGAPEGECVLLQIPIQSATVSRWLADCRDCGWILIELKAGRVCDCDEIHHN
jgi:hypothetical protein